MDEGGADEALALWYSGTGEALLKRETLPALRQGEARLAMLWSGISRGTERLIFHGRVPDSEAQRMRGPHQAGDFPGPVKYGYCAVARVIEGPDALIGRNVFALHPHQSHFILPVEALTPLPDGLPPRRAALAANMETALNGLWDAGVGPGDRVVVVGGGVVGLLAAFLAAGVPGAEVMLVDVDSSRADIARDLGVAFALPHAAPREADVVIHASASAAGLALALDCAGLEATVLELSWHGAGETPVPLGGAFHSRRLRLISSQVGQVSASRRARWSYARRLAKALELLRDDRLDALITGEIGFGEAPARLPALFGAQASGLTAVLRYEAARSDICHSSTA
jgi:NADPH:quinone reductase-like Zn-dependent oxidoreductase